jgi:hypothetical protein
MTRSKNSSFKNSIVVQVMRKWIAEFTQGGCIRKKEKENVCCVTIS